jgi:hypothetical protein
MDCEQVQELLDIYALGVAEADEAAAIEAHVADCVRCWASLNEAQRAVAAIALSAKLERVPPSLRQRVLAESQRPEGKGAGGAPSLLRRLLPAATLLSTAGVVAALAFAFSLQARVNDLNSDKDDLEAEVQAMDARLESEQQAVAVLTAADAQQVSLESTDDTLDAAAVYHWSSTSRQGVLICEGLPELAESEVYKVWLVTDEGSYGLADFHAWRNGGYQTNMSLEGIEETPVAIGVSREQAADVTEPSDMILWADFQR